MKLIQDTLNIPLGNARERLKDGDRVPRWIQLEFLSRYTFAAQYVKHKIVADCACSDGSGIPILMEQNPKKVYAFDLDKESIENAKFDNQYENVSYQVANSLNLPLDDGQVEVYVSLETVEHILEEHGFLSEVTRVLSKDGVFICSTPNRFIANPGRNIEATPWNPYHVREYSPVEIKSLLEVHFASVELYGTSFWPKWQVNVLTLVGKLKIANLAVRLKQISKLFSPWCYREMNPVIRLKEGKIPEYLLLVATLPRK